MKVPNLTVEERGALERFNETCEDGEGYDVPKQMMKRLAEIGVVNHTSRGIYFITEFGRAILSPNYDAKATSKLIETLESTVEQYKKLYDRRGEALKKPCVSCGYLPKQVVSM